MAEAKMLKVSKMDKIRNEYDRGTAWVEWGKWIY